MDELREIRYSIKESDAELFRIVRGLIEKYQNDTYRVVKGEIIYNDQTDRIRYVYYLGTRSAYEQAQALTMEGSGASWFREMRGDGVADDQIKASNRWQHLITQLSEDFYKKNPVLYYEDTKSDFNSDPKITSNIKSLIDLFFGESNVRIEGETADATKMIYAASIRLAVGLSIGVPQPLLGKVYFSRNQDGSLEFMSNEEAEKLENILQNVESDEHIAPPPLENDDDKIVSALEGMLKERAHLEQYFYFQPSNEERIERMMERQHDKGRELPIEIMKVSVNTIFKIKVKAAKYKIYFSRFTHVKTPVLSATVLFDKVSMNCEACLAHTELIRANTIDYTTADGRHETLEIAFGNKGVELRRGGAPLDKADFDRAVADIKASVFSKHLLRVECAACAARDACVGYICEEQQVHVKEISAEGSDSTILRCNDCIYPESFVYVDGVPYTTNSVFYDVNSRLLRLKYSDQGSRAQCPICSRAFYRQKGAFIDVCDLCASLDTEDEQERRKQKRLYAKYAGLLPLTKRVGKDKRCVEDQSIIVFKVGSVYHVFDKIAAIVAGDEFLTGKSVGFDGNSEV